MDKRSKIKRFYKLNPVWALILGVVRFTPYTKLQSTNLTNGTDERIRNLHITTTTTFPFDTLWVVNPPTLYTLDHHTSQMTPITIPIMICFFLWYWRFWEWGGCNGMGCCRGEVVVEKCEWFSKYWHECCSWVIVSRLLCIVERVNCCWRVVVRCEILNWYSHIGHLNLYFWVVSSFCGVIDRQECG